MTIETTSTAGGLAASDRHADVPALSPSEAVTAALREWVAGQDLAVQAAEYVVDTPGCPDSFWPLPGNVKVWEIPGRNPKLQLPNEDRETFLTRRAVAVRTVGFVVRYGLGLGLAPEVSLNGIFVIGGRPTMYAEQMVALIKSHGHGHRVVQRTVNTCVVEVKHRADDTWTPFEFSMDDAITAGYVPGQGPNADKKSGGNAKYLTDPKAMLYARATSIACKTTFPEVLRGMVTYEEALDEQRTVQADVVEGSAADLPRSSARVTADAILAEPLPSAEQLARAAQQDQPADVDPPPAAQPEPGAEKAEQAEPAQPEAAAAKSIEGAQLKKLIGLFRKLGVVDTDERLNIVKHVTGAKVKLPNQLSFDDAGTLIDTLDAISRGPNPVDGLHFLLAEADAAHYRDDIPVEDPPADGYDQGDQGPEAGR